MTKPTATVYINMLTEPYTKGSGRMTSNMEMGMRGGLTGLLMQVSTSMAKSKELVSTNGMMDHSMEESGMKIKSMAS